MRRPGGVAQGDLAAELQQRIVIAAPLLARQLSIAIGAELECQARERRVLGVAVGQLATAAVMAFCTCGLSGLYQAPGLRRGRAFAAR